MARILRSHLDDQRTAITRTTSVFVPLPPRRRDTVG